MEDSSYRQDINARINVLLQVTKCKSIPDFAKALGKTSQAIYDAKKRGVIPESWLTYISSHYGISLNELLEALEKTDIEEEIHLAPFIDKYWIKHENISYFEKIYIELVEEKNERRELNADNRRLYQENASLTREIGELKAKIARLEAQLKSFSGNDKQ